MVIFSPRTVETSPSRMVKSALSRRMYLAAQSKRMQLLSVGDVVALMVVMFLFINAIRSIIAAKIGYSFKICKCFGEIIFDGVGWQKEATCQIIKCDGNRGGGSVRLVRDVK